MSCLRADFAFFPLSGKTPPRCEALSTQDGQLVVPPVHRVHGTPIPAARHGVVICSDHFHYRRPYSVLLRSSRPCPTKQGFFEMFAKLVFVESFCVSGGAPYIAASSRIHCVTPFLDAELDALMVTQCYYIEDAPVANPGGKTGRGNREVDNRPPPPLLV